MKRRILIYTVLCLIILFVALFLTPHLVLSSAKKIISKENQKICSYNPPSEEFYKACKLLNFTSYFPGYGKRSKDILIHNTTSIYGIYFSECLQIKYNAQQLGKDYYFKEFSLLSEEIWKTDTMTSEVYEVLHKENNEKIMLVDESEWINFIDIEETRTFCNLWTDFLINIRFKDDDICEVCCILYE